MENERIIEIPEECIEKYTGYDDVIYFSNGMVQLIYKD